MTCLLLTVLTRSVLVVRRRMFDQNVSKIHFIIARDQVGNVIPALNAGEQLLHVGLVPRFPSCSRRCCLRLSESLSSY